MKIQLAIDFQTAEEGVVLARELADTVDVIEAGTSFLYENGSSVLAKLREAAPETALLADAKIMDAGFEQAEKFFAAGANIVTVLGVADQSTIEGVIRAAREAGGSVMIDLINCADLKHLAAFVNVPEVAYLCVHVPFDAGLLTDLDGAISRVRGAGLTGGIALAGGMDLGRVEQAAALDVSMVVVGRAITGASSPEAIAAEFRAVAA